MSADSPISKEILQRELEAAREVYLHPTPDRVVDNKLMELAAEFVIGKLSGQRILELGVGEQIWTPKLVERFPDVTSLDGSAGLLEAMRARLAGTPWASRWTPVHTYFEDYTPPRPFDAVLATYVLEHVADAAAILRRARDSWLSPGGMLAVAVPHALSLHRRLAVKLGLASRPDELGETDRKLGHKRVFRYDELQRLLEEEGFVIAERHGIMCKVLPNRLLAGCSDAQLRGLFDLGRELPIDYAGAICFFARSGG